MIVQWLGKEERSFLAPLFVAGPDVGDPQVKKAIHSVEIRRRFEEDLWLVASWPPPEFRMIQLLASLM